LVLAALCLPSYSSAQTQKQKKIYEKKMTMQISGEFDVKVTPAAPGDKENDRFYLDKTYHGALDATGKGQMLTAMTPVRESAGYVAIERVEGTLQGRKGSFILQHYGTLARGVPDQIVAVVPDSGTGELEGLTGRMKIRIEKGGKHFYEFEYSLPGKN
jgi:hypothetical protein